MADILHDLTIRADISDVFSAISTPSGLDSWWTTHSSGRAEPGTEFVLYFDPKHDWRAVVSEAEQNRLFELKFTVAGYDWIGTRVRFELRQHDSSTRLRFSHLGWNDTTDHFRVTSFCWAGYLRLLKRSLELNEVLPPNQRYDA